MAAILVNTGAIDSVENKLIHIVAFNCVSETLGGYAGYLYTPCDAIYIDNEGNTVKGGTVTINNSGGYSAGNYGGSYTTGTATQSGFTVTGIGTTWSTSANHLQRPFVFDTSGYSGKITAVNSTTEVEVDISRTVSSPQNYSILTTSSASAQPSGSPAIELAAQIGHVVYSGQQVLFSGGAVLTINGAAASGWAKTNTKLYGHLSADVADGEVGTYGIVGTSTQAPRPVLAQSVTHAHPGSLLYYIE
jgi:hypothetical protein